MVGWTLLIGISVASATITGKETSNEVKELQQCYVCRESFDHAGNKIDDGSENCFNLNGDEYLENCDSKDDSCETAMYADWLHDGSQVFQFTRRCKSGGSDLDGSTNCNKGSSSVIQYKDCFNVCTGNGCNNNLDVAKAHSKLDDNGDPIEISCYEFSSNFDNATGTDFDPENPFFNHADNLNAKSRKCPIFANWGCFIANNTEGDHVIYGNTFNKGCSIFERSDDATECNDHKLFGRACKRQTSTSMGNSGGMEGPLQQCYVCNATFDHAGNRIDEGSGNCFNLVGDEHLEECDSIDDSCETAMIMDWLHDGSQTFHLTRKCHKLRQTESDGDTNCYEGQNSYIQFKDCYNICTGNGCNNNSDIVNANSRLDENGDLIEISCYEFSSNFDEATGSDFDPENPLFNHADNLDDKSRDCPIFANWGCFTANYTKGASDQFGDTGFNKGCSMFERSDNSTKCVEDPNIGESCKRQTSTSMGNPGGLEGPPQQCYVCTETYDHAGNRIDEGPGNCFNLVGDEHLEECDSTEDSCETATYADWHLDGRQTFTFRRKCKKLRSTESDGDTDCFESYMLNKNAQFKDCWNVCTGNGCNKNSDIVNTYSKLDENGDPIKISCYEFSSNFDNGTGTDFDPENPLFNHADNLDDKSRDCPMFANWGCFTANQTKGDFCGDFCDIFGYNSFNKGCSMFERSDESIKCNDHDLGDGQNYGRACKRQTSTSMGNPGGMEKPVQCDMFSLECGFTTELMLDSSCFAEKSFSKSDDLFIQISSSLDLNKLYR